MTAGPSTPSEPTATTYPPESHVLRDLPFDIRTLSADHYRSTIELDRGLVPDGRVSVGALATAVDVMAGSMCGRTIAPDWMATSSLSLHLGELPSSGPMYVDAGVARIGRTTVVVQITMLSADEQTVGEGLVSFSRLPRRESNLDIANFPTVPGERTSFALEGSGLSEPYELAVGTVVLDAAAGVTETPLAPYIQNSFGAVNGGVVATIAEIAARAAADAEGAHRSSGRAAGVARTSDLEVHYLRQARTGPVRTSVAIVRGDEHSTTVRVELVDAGRAEPVGSNESSTNGSGAHPTEDPAAPETAAGADPDRVASWSRTVAIAHVVLQH